MARYDDLSTELSGTGPLNVMTPATLLAGIMTYIWPFASSTGGNIAVAVVYGYVLAF